MSTVFFGNFFHNLSFTESESILNGFLAVHEGKIVGVGKKSEFEAWKHPNKSDFNKIQLKDSEFILPGFIDTHIHASQVPNIGLGLDKPLLDWLNTYTFPLETQYKDDEFTKHVYEKVVRKTIECGTTTATYFGTIWKNSCKILADEALKQGQRALVGKVSANQCSPETYMESTKECIEDNVEFVDYVLSLNSDLVRPIITPRFAITCTADLMKDLALIATKYDLHIQSHISENTDEIKFTRELYPDSKNYAEVYDKAGLLTNKCVMAHGVHLEDDEIKLFAKRGTSVSHCPNSNTNLKSGICDIKRLIAAGVKVGLGTDISGGNRINMGDAIRSALDVSIHLSFFKKQTILGTGKLTENAEENSKYDPIDYKQGLFLATLGGAQALALDNKIGNFLIGKDFDALVIEVHAGNIDKFDLPTALTSNLTEEFKFQQLLQKFLYVGDDRNVSKVYVKGQQVK